MTEIILSATRLSWAAPVQHGSRWDKSAVMLKVRDKILSRDNDTCQGCGFQASDFQEIHHRSGDHSNFKDSNLETLCPLCHQVFHPDLASISSGASMIWLPEITQVELNRLLFAVFAATKKGSSHPLYNVAKAIWGLLEMRKVYLDNQLGKSDPGIYGQMLLQMTKEEYDNRAETMRAIKMLANPIRFEVEVDYWSTVLEKYKSLEKIKEELEVLQNV